MKNLKETNKLKLRKPETNDNVNINDINENMDKLDTKIESIDNNIITLNNGKVDKVNGKQLSTEDYTTEDKNKLLKATEDISQIKVDINKQKESIIIIRDVNINKNNWQSDLNKNIYVYKYYDSRITSLKIVDVYISRENSEKAEGLLSTNESFNGYVELYAEDILEENFYCDLKIVGQVT